MRCFNLGNDGVRTCRGSRSNHVSHIPNLLFQERRLSSSENVKDGIDAYSKLHREADTETRVSSYKQLVNAYYDLATGKFVHSSY